MKLRPLNEHNLEQTLKEQNVLKKSGAGAKGWDKNERLKLRALNDHNLKQTLDEQNVLNKFELKQKVERYFEAVAKT